MCTSAHQATKTSHHVEHVELLQRLVLSTAPSTPCHYWTWFSGLKFSRLMGWRNLTCVSVWTSHLPVNFQITRLFHDLLQFLVDLCTVKTKHTNTKCQCQTSTVRYERGDLWLTNECWMFLYISSTHTMHVDPLSGTCTALNDPTYCCVVSMCVYMLLCLCM